MIGRARHQQGCVSGMLLENVCIIFTSSGTVFHAVPQGADGPVFCRQMVEQYSRSIKPCQQSHRTVSVLVKVACMLSQLIDLATLSSRRKIGAK